MNSGRPGSGSGGARRRHLENEISVAAHALEDLRRAAYRDSRLVPELVGHLNRLAELRQENGETRRAESLYREAINHANEARDVPLDLLVGIHSLLAYLYDQTGKLDKAAEYYGLALEIAERNGLESADTLGVIHNNLGMVYKKLHDFPRAEESYRIGLQILQDWHGEKNAGVASVYNNLGVLYYTNMDAEKARRMHQKALQIRQEIFGEDSDHPDLGQSYLNLGAVFKALGNFRQAEAAVERAQACHGDGEACERKELPEVAELQIDTTPR